MNTWFAIPGTAGGGGAALAAYSGMALKRSTSEMIVAAAGGHNDSADNRVVSIRLDQDAPAWVQRMAPSSSVQRNVAYYADGKPSARHLYWSIHHLSSTDRVMLMGVQFSYGDAWTFSSVDGFDLSTDRWDAAGTHRNILGSAYGSILNPNTGDIWTVQGSSVFKWSATTKSQSQTASFSGEEFARFGVYDTVRDQVVSIGFGDGLGYGNHPNLNAWKVNAAGTARTRITFNPSAGYSQFIADAPSMAGIDHDLVQDKFYFFAASESAPQRVYVITPNSTAKWDIAVLTLGAGTGIPSFAPNGVYTRFRYVPALRGFAYVDPYDKDIWFLRTSD